MFLKMQVFLKNKSYLVELLVLSILLVVSLLIGFIFTPNIILSGDDNFVLNYLDDYKEPGFKLKINGKDYTKKVKVEGEVNTNKLGKYIIKYSYGKGLFKSKKERVVYVKDLTKPVIILSGSREVYLCPNEDYKEDGYKAVDNYDKDITRKIKIKKSDEFYTYMVTDSSKNKSSIKRKIIKKDIVRPVITLKNGYVINVVEGTTYKEEGYQAIDNCDKDITSKVKVEGEVDTNKLGTYEVVYKVEDESHNEARVVRKVNVVKKAAMGTIYLTFDDGPRSGTTDKILDILKEENVKATFFVTNSGPDELIKRIYDEGHSLALHTASHDYSYVYQSTANYFADLKSVQDRVFRLTGYKSMIIRFPGGSSNTISKKYKAGIMSDLTRMVLEQGYKYYDWNLSSGDAGVTNKADGVYDIVTKNLSHDRVNVILMHDTKMHTKDSLQRIIRYAKENGYTFDVIDLQTEMITQHVNN